MTETPKRVLVTGSAGLLGEATISQLTSKPGLDVAAGVDIRPTDGPPGETRRFVSVIRDVREPLDDLIAGFEPEAVVHLAFLLRTHRDGNFAHEVNVDATERLLQACAAGGVKHVVYLSSTTVYGAHSGYTKPYSEDDPPNPVKGFQYSEHKTEAEHLLLRFATEYPDRAVTIMRGCVVMAPGADNFISTALGTRVLPTPAGSDPEMQFLHVDDYTSALDAVLSRRAPGIYNIAGDDTMTWRQVAEAAGARLVSAPGTMLSAATGISWKLHLQDSSPGPGLNLIRYPWIASTEKIKRELGWSPTYTSREALSSWLDGRSKTTGQ